MQFGAVRDPEGEVPVRAGPGLAGWLLAATACTAPPSDQAAANVAPETDVRVTRLRTAEEDAYVGLDKHVPYPQYEVALSNGSDAAWFVVRQSDAPPPDPGAGPATLQAVALRGRPAQGAEDSPAFRLPVGDAVLLATGQRASLTISTSPWWPTQFESHVEVWRLSALTFDGESAETWLARELPADFLATPEREYPAPIKRVDLRIAQRWVIRLTSSDPPYPRASE